MVPFKQLNHLILLNPFVHLRFLVDLNSRDELAPQLVKLLTHCIVFIQ